MTRNIRPIVFFLLSMVCSLGSGVVEVAAAAEAAYRIGPGDVLNITVWDNKDLDQKVFVRPDGKISLPLLGEISAGGLTVAELADTLSEMYSKTVKGARAVVDVADIRSRSIYFVGGVNKTGPLQLTQDLNLLQAISLAGGLSAGVDLASGATVLRGDNAIHVDLVKLVHSGDPTANMMVQPGDTIIVPMPMFVYLQGEVKTPGGIRYTKNLTIVKAIVQAGGFTPLASPSRVRLLRGSGEKKQIIEVNVTDIMEGGKKADIILEPDDIITVPQRLF